MTTPLTTQEKIRKIEGYLFEILLGQLIQRGGFRLINHKNKNMKIKETKLGLELKGRGGWHQIDIIAVSNFPTYFVYPTRLLAEVKNLSSNIDLPIVRNFESVIRDISEDYSIYFRMYRNKFKNYKQRFSDAGVIFSAKGFSPNASNFADAHGIFMISYENNPIISEIISMINEFVTTINIDLAYSNLGEFYGMIKKYINERNELSSIDNRFIANQNLFYDTLNRFTTKINSIKTSLFGLAMGIYPVHLVGTDIFSVSQIINQENLTCTIHYRDDELPLMRLRIQNLGSELLFSAPFAITKFDEDMLFRENMLNLKERYLSYIEIPFISEDNKKRILRLNLDKDFIRVYKEYYEKLIRRV